MRSRIKICLQRENILQILIVIATTIILIKKNWAEKNYHTDQETLMMGSSAHGGRQVEEEMKVPTRKEQESLLRR